MPLLAVGPIKRIKVIEIRIIEYQVWKLLNWPRNGIAKGN